MPHHGCMLGGDFDRVVLQPAAGRGQVLHGRERRRPLGLTGEKLCPAFAPRLEPVGILGARARVHRSEEHTSELQSLMRISYAVFCLKKTTHKQTTTHTNTKSK